MIKNKNHIKSLNNKACWIFDLDNTLYPSSCNLLEQVDKKITKYIADFLGIEIDKANKTRKSYYQDYGTTLSGMMLHHGMEPIDYLNYIHDIDLKEISPNLALDRALSKISGRKIIYTNGTTKHAERILKKLSIHHHFEEIFDIIKASYIPKPSPKAFEEILGRLKIDARSTVMVEDLVRNLIPAANLGMTTVWVRSDQKLALNLKNKNKIHHIVDNLTIWLNSIEP
ncbi:MAG: pyrimidine 5'-nucleotidase [Pseudomonadota bacterium]|nr:pyrimidine 5'-nucleotidase [Pseudomonadota bacterium]